MNLDATDSERWAVALLLAIGALPWCGYLLLGHWNDRELALATLVLIFIGCAEARTRLSRRG